MPSNQYSDESRKCQTCPAFTTPFESGCELDSVISLEKEALRFNLSPMKLLINSSCHGRSLCYNKKFIGYKE